MTAELGRCAPAKPRSCSLLRRQKFPAPTSREFHRKTLTNGRFSAAARSRKARFEKIPCKFPVDSGTQTHGPVRPRLPPRRFIQRGLGTGRCAPNKNSLTADSVSIGHDVVKEIAVIRRARQFIQRGSAKGRCAPNKNSQSQTKECWPPNDVDDCEAAHGLSLLLPACGEKAGMRGPFEALRPLDTLRLAAAPPHPPRCARRPLPARGER
jgi:hypothetical protein